MRTHFHETQIIETDVLTLTHPISALLRHTGAQNVLDTHKKISLSCRTTEVLNQLSTSKTMLIVPVLINTDTKRRHCSEFSIVAEEMVAEGNREGVP